jgi:hypothetical protein
VLTHPDRIPASITRIGHGCIARFQLAYLR